MDNFLHLDFPWPCPVSYTCDMKTDEDKGEKI